MKQQIKTIMDEMFGQYNKYFDPTEFRLSQSGYHPKFRLMVALGMIENNPIDDDGIFWVGHAYEEMLAHEIAKRFLHKTRKQLPCEYKGTIGHADIMIYGGKPTIVEIKTGSLKVVQSMPNFTSLMQNQAYVHFYNLKHLQNIANGILVYIPREAPKKNKIVENPYNPIMGKDIQETLEMLISLKKIKACPRFFDKKYDKYYIPWQKLYEVFPEKRPATISREFRNMTREVFRLKHKMNHSKSKHKEFEAEYKDRLEKILPLLDGEKLELNGNKITKTKNGGARLTLSNPTDFIKL